MACFDGACSSVTTDTRKKVNKEARDGRSKHLELHLTEAEFETLVRAARSDCRFAELEFKLRAAWRRAPSQSDYRSAIPDVS
jgi:hypothetical protein